MIKRKAYTALMRLAEQFPVVAVTAYAPVKLYQGSDIIREPN